MAPADRTPDILRDARRIVSDADFAATCTAQQRQIAWLIERNRQTRFSPVCLRLTHPTGHHPKDAA